MLNHFKNPSNKPDMSLHFFFTQAVSAAWHDSVGFLPPSWQKQMVLPQIVLNPDLKVWGRWIPTLLQIELRSSLATEHPWYALVDVLGHEIAHQVCSSCFPGLQETSHGPTFRKVCHHLRVSFRAHEDYPLLNQVVFSNQTGVSTPEQQMLTRIQKLLALSSSSNQHEAETALAKARELAGKYNLELQARESAPGDDYYAVSIGEGVARRDAVVQLASVILSQFYEVMAIWIKEPDLEQQRMVWRLYIQGRRNRLLVATYAHQCMLDHVQRAWLSQPLELRCKRSAKTGLRDFGLGVLTAFKAALIKQNEEPQMSALVQRSDVGLELFYHWRYPCIRRGRHMGGLQINDDIWDAGHAAGRELHIRPGLDRTTALPKSLPGG